MSNTCLSLGEEILYLNESRDYELNKSKMARRYYEWFCYVKDKPIEDFKMSKIAHILVKTRKGLSLLKKEIKRLEDKLENTDEIKGILTEINKIEFYINNPNNTYEQQKKQAKIVPIESFIKHKFYKNKKNIMTLCPFHEDRSPSFCINTEKNTFYCFAGCGQGDVIEFVKKLHNTDFKGAIAILI